MAEQKLFAGHAVRRIRRATGLTQAAMAEVLQVSPSYLNLIERNQRPLTASIMLRLADRYDFDPRTLTGAAPAMAQDAQAGTQYATHADAGMVLPFEVRD